MSTSPTRLSECEVHRGTLSAPGVWRRVPGRCRPRWPDPDPDPDSDPDPHSDPGHGPAAAQDPAQAFARGQAERYEAWRAQIRELAERGVAEGEFSSDDLDGRTVRCPALAGGLAPQRLRRAPPPRAEGARRHLNRLIETELRRRS
ncbi:TetR family transcriptional regulator C-terminal domain-containing protein [Streptomyces sp. NPDC059340]|uniref:TetR family transcriptional regulator C-terminal domain-containing protein n=1 Tax=Streptomyces sp. NPDC059340 TaxID=3346806 RepID=UPI0036ADFA7B